jgi:hypothetical protein
MAKSRSKYPSPRGKVQVVARPKHKVFLFAILAVALFGLGTYGLVLTYADSNPKVVAPAGDQAHFPKMAAPANTVASQAPVRDTDDSVESVVPDSPTSGTVTMYDPGPGEDKHTLFKKLKASKVKGLVDPNTGSVSDYVIPADSGGGASGLSTCWVYGSARGSCVAWRNLGHAHPQIYFVDHTSAQWPVSTATYRWNQANGIDSWYRWGSCPALSGIHCVPVHDGNYGSTGWIGLTHIYFSSGIITSAYIQLNRYYDSNYGAAVPGESMESACHEEGHALGMNHNTSPTSCMYATDTADILRPDSNDYSLLAFKYSVRR